MRQINASGLRIAGNAYEYDMMSYVLMGAMGSYAAKYCVLVE